MAEMSSEVPRHTEEIRKMERQWRGCLLGTNENFASEEAALLLAGMDSAGGESSNRKEAKEESGKRSEKQYEWMKRPEESEVSYEKRLMGSARGLRREALGPAKEVRDRNIARRQRETNSKEKARTKPKVEAKDAEAGKAKPPVTDAGKPEESVSGAEKAEESVIVGSCKSAMNQEVIGLSCTDDEEILQQVLQYKLDRGFILDESEEKERAMLKGIQERMAKTKKALLQWQKKLPTKDEESGKAEAPVTEAGKPEESALDQEVIADDKESLEQVLKDKLDILDLEEDLNRTTESASDPNSMTIQDDHVDKGKLDLVKKTADKEAKAYYWHRKYWETNCCKNCDHFEQITVLSSMQYTHCTPRITPYNIVETVQIFSVKLKLTDDNAGGFELPLSVYGMVAVRDNLDSKRNILFSCGRTKAQELTKDDPFLHLTGPSRAIVCTDKVCFEIDLKVKGAAGSQDKPLITCARDYAGGCSAALCFDNVLCTLEVCLQTVKRSVQATIVGVQIVKKKELWPLNFTYGGLVTCTPLPRKTVDGGSNQKIVLIESKDREMPQCDSGHLHLWRQVVSVESGGGLDVVIQAYNKFGAVGAESHVHFKAQNFHMSQKRCTVGPAQVSVAVAWSVVPTDMDDVVYNI